MEKDRSNAEIAAKAHEDLRKSASVWAPSLFAFLLILLCFAALSIVSILLSIIFACFVVIPYFFGFTHQIFVACNAEKEGALSNQFFLAYFRPNFRGIYKVLLNLLRALGVSVAASTFFAAIYIPIVYFADPSFAYSINVLSDTLLSSSDTINIYNLPGILRYMEISSCVSVGAGVAGFLFFAKNYTMNGLFRVPVAELPSSVANLFYNHFYRLVRKDYKKLLWSKAWYVLISFPVLFALGLVLSLSLKIEYPFTLAIALAFGGFGLALSAPLFIALNAEFLESRVHERFQCQVSFSEDMLRRATRFPGISEEELESLRKSIESAKDALKEYEEKQGEESDKD